MPATVSNEQLIKPIKKKNFIWWYILFLSITSFTLYYRSVNDDFLDLDDMTIVVKNYPFLKIISNAPKAFEQGVFQQQGIKDTLISYYRPMVTLSLMLDSHLFPSGSDVPKPKPFLAANIFYHTLACILLLILLLELNIPPLTAFILSMIFTVHPLLNQAVAWIPGRNDSLLAIFILGAFLFLLKMVSHKSSVVSNGSEKRDTTQSKRRMTYDLRLTTYDSKLTTYLVLHSIFFLLALFTKESAIMLIPLSFLFLRFVSRKTLPNKTYITLALVYFVCLIPWFLLRRNALATNENGFYPLQILKTLLHNSPYYLQYAGNAILPFKLSVMSTPTDTYYPLAIAAILLVMLSLWLTKKETQPGKWSAKRDMIIFGLLWFILFLTPSLFSTFSGLEHRMYVPMIGVVLIVSQLNWLQPQTPKGALKSEDAAIQSPFRGWGQGNSNLWLLTGIFILFFCLSASHLKIFENRFVFDRNAMETSPKSVLPCFYLAQHYEEEKNYDSAISVLREALRRDSTYPNIRSNIGGDYIRKNDYKDAEIELRKDFAMHPKNPFTAFNLGLVIFQVNYNRRDSTSQPDSITNQKIGEGVGLWKKALELDSGFAKPYYLIGEYYRVLGDSANSHLYRNLYLKKFQSHEN